WGAGSRQMTVVDALAAAERRIDTSLADQPDVAVAVKRTIAGGYSGLGEYARAERLLHSAVETTRPHAERRADLVETLNLLGGVFRQAGRLDDASRVQGEALALTLEMGESAGALSRASSRAWQKRGGNRDRSRRRRASPSMP
ncbi:MAG: tetratricopeptide repeat protein, partial [Chloroflexota bacterium]|nr:tetratricopeptide repeat protein [Chloroflexota bacterium]